MNGLFVSGMRYLESKMVGGPKGLNAVTANRLSAQRGVLAPISYSAVRFVFLGDTRFFECLPLVLTSLCHAYYQVYRRLGLK